MGSFRRIAANRLPRPRFMGLNARKKDSAEMQRPNPHSREPIPDRRPHEARADPAVGQAQRGHGLERFAPPSLCRGQRDHGCRVVRAVCSSSTIPVRQALGQFKRQSPRFETLACTFMNETLYDLIY